MKFFINKQTFSYDFKRIQGETFWNMRKNLKMLFFSMSLKKNVCAFLVDLSGDTPRYYYHWLSFNSLKKFLMSDYFINCKYIGLVLYKETSAELWGYPDKLPVDFGGTFMQTGVILEFDAPVFYLDHRTRTGRVYPTDTMQKALDSKVIKNKLSTNTFFGYFCPSLTDLEQVTTRGVDLTKVSHSVTSFSISDDRLLSCHIQVLDTPRGRLLKEAFLKDEVYAISMGTGNEDQDNVVYSYVLEMIYFKKKEA